MDLILVSVNCNSNNKRKTPTYRNYDQIESKVIRNQPQMTTKEM